MARPSEDVLGIQYLRGIAATIVVFYHTGVNTPDFAWPAALPRGAGSSGVDIFFVISGFIMTYITSVKPVPLGKFVKHRLIRVVPLYWFFNAIIIAGGLIYPAAMLNNRIIPDHILLSLAFIPHINPITGDTLPFYKLGWTLNYEVYFYLCFGLLLMFADAAKRFVLLALLYCLSATLYYLIKPESAVGLTYLSPLLLEFVFGAAIARAWLAGALDRIPPALCLAMIGVAIAALLFVGEAGADAGRPWLQGIPAAMIVTSVLALERNGRLPTSGLLLLLGNASYSLYLSHTTTLTFFRIAAKLLRLPVENPAVGAALVFGGFFTALIGGILCYRLIEAPLLKFCRARFG